MPIFQTEQNIENEYHISWYIIAYKLLFGFSEFVLGIGIVFFGSRGLQMYQIFARNELSEDPHDLLVHLTEGIVPGLLTHSSFLALYLIVLGGAKIAGAIGLIYKQNWGVDLLVSLTLLMLPFEVIQLIRQPSFPGLVYIAVALFIAFYLINFRPHDWVGRMKHRFNRYFQRNVG